MGNPRSFTTKHNAINRKLEAALRAKGITKSRRRSFVEHAASGRPADIEQQAREALRDWRVQRDLDIISGAAEA